jgi:hypothetical protein
MSFPTQPPSNGGDGPSLVNPAKPSSPYFTLTEAAALFPGRRPGKRVSVQTVWRWCMRGVRKGIRLRSVLVGGQRYTTPAWINDFIEAVTRVARPEEVNHPAPRVLGFRQKASDAAAEELRARWKRRGRRNRR